MKEVWAWQGDEGGDKSRYDEEERQTKACGIKETRRLRSRVIGGEEIRNRGTVDIGRKG